MLFDQEALQNKKRYIDVILQTPELAKNVVSRHISDSFELNTLPRVWEPGGGSTLFGCNTFNGSYLLKVKHRSVYVESRLESEKDYHRKPSLQNEYEFIKSLNVEWVPKVLFFDEHEDFQFLAFEWLKSFDDATKEMTALQLIDCWKQINNYVRILYTKGIVHTDIHEHNICFRGGTPILIDFEEARFLKQNVGFEESLDVIGENMHGNVGDFPTQNGGIGGMTCLKRLRRVFESLIKKQLPDLLSECNFDDKCPYNMDELQAPDPRIYQSLNLPGLIIEGHRPKRDVRLKIFSVLLNKLARRLGTVKHLDIGSNLGIFCFQAAKHRKVGSSVGLEAFHKYIEISLILGFLYNYPKAKFFHFVCGEDTLKERLGETSFDFVTMLSVYHHIPRKDAFLQELKKTGAKFLLVELATEKRYYPERGGFSDELNHIGKVMDYRYSHLLGYSVDYHRPLVLFSNDKLTWIDHMVFGTILRQTAFIARLRNAVKRRWNRLTSALTHLKWAFSYVRSMLHNYGFLQRLKPSSYRALQWVINHAIDGSGIRYSNHKLIPYPEVTGYYVPTLMNWGEHRIAVNFVKWLLTIQNGDGSWPEQTGKIPYTFDTGQILKGLICILPRMPEVEQSILRGCDWMLTQVKQNGQVTTPDISAWRLPGGKIISDNIHLYALEPLRKAGELFDKPEYTEAVKRALAHYLAKPDIIAFNTLSHFHAYVLEALVDLGYPDIAARGMVEVEQFQRKDGSVPAYPNVKWICSTGLAQYAVIWYKLGRRELAEKAFNYLCRIQNPSGGFYGSYGHDANYFPNEEISWAVKYFLDAWYWRIKTSFDAEIAHFPESIDEQDGRVQEILSFLGDLNGKKVIDVGCGKGRFLRILQERFLQAELHGLDISETMLRHCPEDIQTLCGNILDIRHPDASFDAVYCVEALEHAVNIETAISEMCRILKPGGKILIIDKNIEKIGRLKISPWEKWFSREEIEKQLHKYNVHARSKFITYEKHDRPDGLFIAWEGVKQTGKGA